MLLDSKHCVGCLLLARVQQPSIIHHSYRCSLSLYVCCICVGVRSAEARPRTPGRCFKGRQAGRCLVAPPPLTDTRRFIVVMSSYLSIVLHAHHLALSHGYLQLCFNTRISGSVALHSSLHNPSRSPAEPCSLTLPESLILQLTTERQQQPQM